MLDMRFLVPSETAAGDWRVSREERGGQTDAACHNIGRRGPSTRKGLRGAISQRSGCRRCECWIQFHLVKPSLQPETCRVYLREAGRWRKHWPDENLLKCVALLCCKEERNGKEKVESLVILPRISWQGQLRWKKKLSFVKRSTAKLGSKLLHLSDAHSGRWHRAQLLQLFFARITGWYKKKQKKNGTSVDFILAKVNYTLHKTKQKIHNTMHSCVTASLLTSLSLRLNNSNFLFFLWC